MSASEFLDRIGDRGPRSPTAETLTRLHRAHMMSVPFENLDIPLGRPIELSIPAFYEKVVRQRRGGFCYELNGLFAWLLERLGFSVALLSARVYGDDGPGPEFDHMLLLIEPKGSSERWIADVGFGDSFIEPLRFDVSEAVEQHGGEYRLRGPDDERALWKRRGGDWQPQFVFSVTPRQLPEFADMCRHQQTSPRSSFTRKSTCSLATPAGRVTLTDDRLIEIAAGARDERRLRDADEVGALLMDRFGIDLADAGRLWPRG